MRLLFTQLSHFSEVFVRVGGLEKFVCEMEIEGKSKNKRALSRFCKRFFDAYALKRI